MRWFFLTALVPLAVFFLLRRVPARARARARRRLEKHMGSPEAGKALTTSARRILALLGQKLAETRYARRLRRALEISGVSVSRERFCVLLLGLVVLLPLLAFTMTGSALSIPPALTAALFIPFPALDFLKRRAIRKGEEQCEQLAADVALYLRCGIPVEEAVVLSIPDFGPPLSGTLARFQAAVAMGARADTAFQELTAELDNSDFELISHAVVTSRETGSDIRGIMKAVGEALRERSAIRRELYSQTIQGRLSGRIVAGLPLIFLGMSALVSRTSLAVLFGTLPGLLMLLAAGALELLGFLWIRRILDIRI